MSRFDRHDTPHEVAEVLASAVSPKFDQPVIADFAAGSGVLLEAAEKRWPMATILALLI